MSGILINIICYFIVIFAILVTGAEIGKDVIEKYKCCKKCKYYNENNFICVKYKIIKHKNGYCDEWKDPNIKE